MSAIRSSSLATTRRSLSSSEATHLRHPSFTGTRLRHLIPLLCSLVLCAAGCRPATSRLGASEAPRQLTAEEFLDQVDTHALEARFLALQKRLEAVEAQLPQLTRPPEFTNTYALIGQIGGGFVTCPTDFGPLLVRTSDIIATPVGYRFQLHIGNVQAIDFPELEWIVLVRGSDERRGQWLQTFKAATWTPAEFVIQCTSNELSTIGLNLRANRVAMRSSP